MSDVMRIGSGDPAEAENIFRALLEEMTYPRVLEMGTLRWEEDLPTHHKHWAPHASEYWMTDVEAGTDVDIVADAHTIDKEDLGMFDAVIAVSVWEHLQRPWVAAKALGKIVKKGGIVIVVTHQTFPLHGYPNDFFRFSTEALTTIFEDAKFKTTLAGYQYPCQIIPPDVVTRWNRVAEAYLNVVWMGAKA